MKRVLFFVAAVTVAALPVSRASAQAIDSAHVIRVHAGANAADAYSRVAHTLIGLNYSITGAVPGLAMSAVANDAASIAILVSLDDDGSAYCAAELMTAGGGVILNGTGTSSGGGAIAVERGTRAGKDAWARLEKFAAALAIGAPNQSR